MRIGFTGTRAKHVHELLAVVDEHIDKRGGSEFTTGACIGFDAVMARHLLRTRPDAIHRLIVPQNRSQVDTDLFHEFITHTGGWASIEFMPKGSDYRARNARILDHADALVAVAEYPEDDGRSRRSGTWMTVRMGREQNRQRLNGFEVVELVLPQPVA